LGNEFLSNNFYFIILINEFTIIAPVLVYMKAKKADIKENFKFKSLDSRHALLILIMAFPAYAFAVVLNNIVIFLVQFAGEVPDDMVPVPESLGDLLLGIFFIGVIPAICEEILARGLLLKAYEKAGIIRAVIYSAFLFGIIHFDITNFLGPVFLGILMGYYVIRTNSIFAGMLAHFANNAIAEIIAYLINKNVIYDTREIKTDVITVSDLSVMAVAGIISLVLLYFLLKKFKSATEYSKISAEPSDRTKSSKISVFFSLPVIMTIILYLIMAVFYVLVLHFN